MRILLGWLILALQVYSWLVVMYAIMSWVPRRSTQPSWLSNVRDFLTAVCEPYLGLFRRLMRPAGGGGVAIDFSPLIGLLVLWVAEILLGQLAAFVP